MDLAIQSRAWWSVHRRRYNVALIVAAPISAGLFLVIWGLLGERLPCLEVTAFSFAFGAFLFLVGLAAANVFYFLGPLAERIVRPKNALFFRQRLYFIGVSFSLLLIFLPPIVNLTIAVLGLSCVDEFGVVHTVR